MVDEANAGDYWWLEARLNNNKVWKISLAWYFFLPGKLFCFFDKKIWKFWIFAALI